MNKKRLRAAFENDNVIIFKYVSLNNIFIFRDKKTNVQKSINRKAYKRIVNGI